MVIQIDDQSLASSGSSLAHVPSEPERGTGDDVSERRSIAAFSYLSSSFSRPFYLPHSDERTDISTENSFLLLPNEVFPTTTMGPGDQLLTKDRSRHKGQHTQGEN